MIVYIPSRLTKDTIYDLLNNVIDKNIEPVDKIIHFDFSNLTFIEPAGTTILSNLFEWLLKNDVECLIKGIGDVPNDKSNPIKYLDDSMFFKRYLGKTITQNANLRKTTMPLELVGYTRSFGWMEHAFIPWLANNLNTNNKSLTDIKMCLGEIFNNINDHSNQNIGCINAQHYPKWNKITISISDFGVGIPFNVRKLGNNVSDGQAIYQAIQEGFSTRSTPRNRGAGLHTLLTNVVKNNGGSIHIHSNYGILNCTNDNGSINYSYLNEESFYPGTFLEINLRTDNIDNIEDDEEEFTW